VVLQKTIDGVTVTNGQRVLVKNQASGATNGIYVVASGAWTRATDYDNTPGGEITNGDIIPVTSGSTQNNHYGHW
jgi:phage-related tail fiber protein